MGVFMISASGNALLFLLFKIEVVLQSNIAITLQSTSPPSTYPLP